MIWMKWPYPAVRRDDAKVFFSFLHKHLCSILYLEYVLIFLCKMQPNCYDVLEGFYNVLLTKYLMNMRYLCHVLCFVNMLMYFNNISQKKEEQKSQYHKYKYYKCLRLSTSVFN